MSLAVHGDDFVSEGLLGDLKWLDVNLRKSFEFNTEIMGETNELLKELKLLNRIIGWTQHGTTWEPDPRHVDIRFRDLQLGDGKATPVVTPGDKEAARRAAALKEEKEQQCEECNLVHAYDKGPANGAGSLQPSMTSAISSEKK